MRLTGLRAGTAGLMLVLAAGCATAPEMPVPGGQPQVALTSRWTPLPAAPLSARHDAVGEWVAGRFVVLGGRSSPACPPNASCVAPPDPDHRDGAAFDPRSGRWTPIADAPVPLDGLIRVVAGDRIYLLTSGQIRDDSEAAFLSYDPGRDSWTTHPLPPVRGVLVAAGSAVVSVPDSDEQDPAVDAIFSPGSNSWRRLPDDPLGPSFDRSAVWIDGSLLLAGKDLVPNPGSDTPALVRLARLDDDLSRWSALPDSEIIGYAPVAVGGLVVWPYPGSADGGEVNGWGRAYPEGGIYDPATGTWRPLPPRPFAASGCCPGIQVAGRVGIGNQLLDPVTEQWTEIPPVPGAHRTSATIVGGDDTVLVWGGATFEGDGFGATENLATGYLLRLTR